LTGDPALYLGNVGQIIPGEERHDATVSASATKADCGARSVFSPEDSNWATEPNSAPPASAMFTSKLSFPRPWRRVSQAWLTQQGKFFPYTLKHRALKPSEIRALDFKGEFRRSAICSVSATIGINRSIPDVSTGATIGINRAIFEIFRENGIIRFDA
jgi:hypothetical protein